MSTNTKNINQWSGARIIRKQIEKYLDGKNHFIKEDLIASHLSNKKPPDPRKVKDILLKSLEIKTLTLEETACLIRVTDLKLLDQMRKVALEVKKKVYDNRIVTFAPLYLGNYCINDCLYCGFRHSNKEASRRVLSLDEVRNEVKVLAGDIGHKRLIAVYGEHPFNDINYMVESIKTIYAIKVKTKNGFGQIRRVNVNASPLSIEGLKQLKEVGIGTYQVFQETYHQNTYKKIHPQNTVKGNYLWRLYAMHRAFEAGVDDVGLGVLFGLYNWQFEVMALVSHDRELEERFGIGAHTVSFPRLEPAANTPFTENPKYKVLDEDFKKLITIIRLAIPHTGMIITARENQKIRQESIELGITQTDASTKISIGSYSESGNKQEGSRQQFLLGDTRSLDEVIREFVEMGYITSFCTAGYRCGRTGKCIMELLRNGQEGKFCKLNAVLTFREWLDDFATEETKKISEPVLNREIEQIKQSMPGVFPEFIKYYERIKNGERDLYF